MFDIDLALRYLVDHGGSDLHVKVPSPPMVRIDGELSPVEGAESLTPEDTQAALHKILAKEQGIAEFEEEGEVDFSYSVPGLARFRVNAFRQRGSVSIACRAIPYGVPSIDELGLPEAVRELAMAERGIVLVTGATGSGKSTTLASMIREINENRTRHVITLEDPIEYLHRDQRSIVNQREIGEDTRDFPRALRRVLRQDPDVILIGEMRDTETARTALAAAETGHLVFSTLHTLNATESVNRIIDLFPPHLQHQSRVMLAATLRGTISQRLVRRADGSGRLAVCEVLMGTDRARDLIVDPERTAELHKVIVEGSFYGMQSFDQDLTVRVLAGEVTVEDALQVATSPNDFKLMLDAASGAPPAEAPAPNGNGHSGAAGTNGVGSTAPEPVAHT